MGGVTVIVGTFGDSSWEHLARSRAIPSIDGQAPYIHCHRDTLAEARNAALEMVATEYVIHLDADDQLTSGYVDAMLTGTADVRAGSMEQVRGRRIRHFMPKVWGHEHDCEPDCLRVGNYIHIGALARTSLLRGVGGWREFGWSEDWDLWLRCRRAGASIESIPEAIYRAHYSATSRNHAPSAAEKAHWHKEIYEANFPDAVADAA